jgi:hypothetical protein
MKNVFIHFPLSSTHTYDFIVLTSKWFFMTPSIATKFQYINSLLFSLFYSLHISAPTGHPQMRYTISYLTDYFNTTDPLHVCNLTIRMLFAVIGFSTYSPNTCYLTKYKNKNCKISKFHATSGVVPKL